MSPSDASAASCVGVVKVYRAAAGEVHALKGIDAAFRRGEVTAVVGPSGSGKSSLLRILAALDRATAGAVVVAGVALAGLDDRRMRRTRRAHIGVIRQRPSHNLVPHLTAGQQVEHAARMRGAALDEVDALLDAVAMSDRRRHVPSQLSGGEQQRIAVAAAVVGSPTLVVADEPTAELDSVTARAVIALLHRYATHGSAIVLSTHDDRVVATADRVYTLRHGAMATESSAVGDVVTPIDAAGRCQLPPETLAWFGNRRARIEVGDRAIVIRPDESAEPV